MDDTDDLAELNNLSIDSANTQRSSQRKSQKPKPPSTFRDTEVTQRSSKSRTNQNVQKFLNAPYVNTDGNIEMESLIKMSD